MLHKQGLQIEEISSITGYSNSSISKYLSENYNSIINAIILYYNNGLVEGSVNELKTINRKMYGRNNFDLLRSKIIHLENLKRINRI